MNATSQPCAVNANTSCDSAFEVEAITSETTLWAAKDDWERLQQNALSPNVFTTWGWIWSWWRVFGREEPATRLFVVTTRQGGQLTGILPLVSRPARRWLSLRKLEFPDLTFADYMDPLLRNDSAGTLTAMFAFLAVRRDDWDLLMLRRVRGQGDLHSTIAHALRHAGLRWRQRGDETYLWMPITGRFEEMQSARSRQTHRRKLNRMHEAGLRCRVLEHPESEPGLLDRMAVVERKRMIQGGAPGLLLAQDTAFFAHVFETLGAAGWLYVGVVEQAGNLIGYELGFRCGRKLSVYTKGYDAAYASFSPGSMLTAVIIDYGFERGYVEYDMLRGREEFKKRLTQYLHKQVRFEVWNRSVRSQLAAGVFYGARVVLISTWWRLLGRPIHPDL